MPTEITRVCKICRKEECRGRAFKTPDMWGSYGFHVGFKEICESDPHIRINNEGKYIYRLVSGHGDFADYELIEIK